MTTFTVEISDISRVRADGETNARVTVSIKEWREHNLIGEISLEVVVAAEDGARIASRTDQLTGALDPIAQNSRTSAVMSTRQGRKTRR